LYLPVNPTKEKCTI